MSAAGTRQVVRLIAAREVRERLRAKSYYLLTGILVVLIIAAGVIARLADTDPETLDLAVTSAAPADFGGTVEVTAGSLDRQVELTTVDSSDAARQAVEDGDADVAILVEERVLLYDGDLGQEAEAIAQLAWQTSQVRQALLGAGLTPEQLASAFTAEPLTTESIDGDDDEETDGIAILVGTATAILLFMSLQTFGGYVLMGVVEEKSTAVVEVLLARVRSDQLLAGKVIGIGIAALLQFAAAIGAGVVALAISGTEVPSAVWSSLPTALLWFLGGYAFYSILYALAGSLVSRQEDAQAASAPIMTAMIIAYLLVYIFGYVPESTISAVLSVIPVTAPFLMPMRMAAGAASIVEIAASIALLAVTIVAVWKLSGRVYEQMVLRRGSRIAWGEALKLGRSSR